VKDPIHLLDVWRYVERNPVKAGLVERAEEWHWSSAASQRLGRRDLVLDDGPVSRPPEWLAIVNHVDPVPVETPATM
jgi:putative transposase